MHDLPQHRSETPQSAVLCVFLSPFLKKIGVIFPFFQALVNSLDHYDSSNRMEKCLATTSGSWMHVIRSYKLLIQLH